MGPIVPRDVAEAAEAKVGLIGEGGRLQRVAGALGAKMPGRNRAQLRVDDGQQALERTVVSLLPGAENLGDLIDREILHPRAARRRTY